MFCLHSSWRGTLVVLMMCIIIVSSLKTPKWPSLHNRQLKTVKSGISSISRTFKNESLSFWNRMSERRKSRPFSLFKKRFDNSSTAVAANKLFYNPSDPLHAYPNRLDLLVHNLFQRAARFEVNNADTVRAVLRGLRVTSLLGSVVGVVGLAVGLAVGIPAAIGRRNDFIPEDRIDWSFVDHAAQTVINAIQNGQLQYEV